MAAPGTVIAYPVQIHYTLYLPGGASNFHTTLNSGNPTAQDIAFTIPYFINNDYIYSVSLTDACGTTYPAGNFIVNNDIAVTSGTTPLPCNKYFFTINKLTARKVKGWQTYPLSFWAGHIRVSNSIHRGPLSRRYSGASYLQLPAGSRADRSFQNQVYVA